jgi:hypothetical protein
VIRGNKIVNILDLLTEGGGGGGTTTIDAYTKAETDTALLLKQNTFNWSKGDSSAKNTISTGDGILLITMPGENGSYTPAVLINGPGITDKEGQASFYSKVIMLDALEVSGAITAGGMSVITSSSLSQRLGETLLLMQAYTIAETYNRTAMDAALLLKQNNLNWIFGDSTAKSTISTGEGILTMAMPTGATTFDNVMVINGSLMTGKEGHVSFFKKVTMTDALEVSGAITAGGLSVLTTGTGYTKKNVDDLLLLQEPRFNTTWPILKDLNMTTMKIDLILDSEFIDKVSAKGDTADLSGYQPKLSNDSTIGYSVIGPDNKTVYSLEASNGIHLTPTYTMTNNVPSNYRIQIKVDDVYTAAAQTHTNTQIAAIPKAFWVAGKIAAGGTPSKMNTTVLGRYDFEVRRTTGTTAGVFTITFGTAYANAHFVVNVSHQDLQSVTTVVSHYYPPTVNGFTVVCYNVNNALQDCNFHFSVLAP